MSRWTILSVLFTARISMAIAFQSVAAILPFLVRDLGLTYTQAGTLIGLFMLPGVLLAIPTGWLGTRFGDKAVTLFGLGAMVVGCVWVAQAESFGHAALGRVICGIGAITLNVLLAKMTTDWFANREIATAMGFLVSSFPVGLALAMVVFGWWVTIAAWPMILYATAGVSALGMGLMAVAYRRPSGTPTTAPGLSFQISRRDLELAFLAGLVWGALNAGGIIFLSFSPTYLIERGWSAASASSTSSLVVWLCVPLILFGGHIADRTGSYDLLIAGTALLTALLMTAMPLVPAGPVMALPQVLPAAERAAGFGTFFTVYYACMGVVPAAAGLALDLSGDPSVPLLFAAAVMASMAPLLWLFRVRAAGLGAQISRGARAG